MKDYEAPTAQVEDEKAYSLRCRAMGFVFASSMAKVGWIQSHVSRKGYGGGYSKTEAGICKAR